MSCGSILCQCCCCLLQGLIERGLQSSHPPTRTKSIFAPLSCVAGILPTRVHSDELGVKILPSFRAWTYLSVKPCCYLVVFEGCVGCSQRRFFSTRTVSSPPSVVRFCCLHDDSLFMHRAVFTRGCVGASAWPRGVFGTVLWDECCEELDSWSCV